MLGRAIPTDSVTADGRRQEQEHSNEQAEELR